METDMIDKESEEFMEEVYKKELGIDFAAVDEGVAVSIDFTKDSEYIRLYNRESTNEREN
jgi:hypothetical protein